MDSSTHTSIGDVVYGSLAPSWEHAGRTSNFEVWKYVACLLMVVTLVFLVIEDSFVFLQHLEFFFGWYYHS